MVKDMLPFCRPLRGFGLVGRPYCAGAPPLPVVCRLSEAFPFWLASSETLEMPSGHLLGHSDTPEMLSGHLLRHSETPNVQSGHLLRRSDTPNVQSGHHLGIQTLRKRHPVTCWSIRRLRTCNLVTILGLGDSENAIRSPVGAFGDS